MFGWEYPPHVYGGLATANFGITQGLHAQGDVDITLCLPKPFGDEDHSAAKIVAMNCVPIAWRNVDYDYVKNRIGNVMDPDYYFRLRDHLYADCRQTSPAGWQGSWSASRPHIPPSDVL